MATIQLDPLDRMFAGSIGITTARVAGQTVGTGPDIASELGEFVATMVTGGILIAAALLLGTIVRIAWAASKNLRSWMVRVARPQTA